MSFPLEEIESIRRLKYRYCRCIDSCNCAATNPIRVENSI